MKELRSEPQMPHSATWTSAWPSAGRGLVDVGEVEALGFDPLGGTHADITACAGGPAAPDRGAAVVDLDKRSRRAALGERRGR